MWIYIFSNKNDKEMWKRRHTATHTHTYIQTQTTKQTENKTILQLCIKRAKIQFQVIKVCGECMRIYGKSEAAGENEKMDSNIKNKK